MKKPKQVYVPKVRLARINEACAYARMSRAKLYMKLKDGTITARRREREVMVDLDSIDAYHETLPKWTLSDGLPPEE